jgi:hypothetical protein
VLQFGCKTVPGPPTTAASGVSQAVSGDDYALAWKGPPANTLLGWGSGSSSSSSPGAREIIGTVLGNQTSRKVSNVAQMSAAATHALVLRTDGTLIAGWVEGMSDYAVPKPGAIKGRLVRVAAAAGGGSTGLAEGYSLGIVVTK